MSKKAISYFVIFVVAFSLSVSTAMAATASGCQNPSGGNYCGQKSQVSDCYCDAACVQYGDCCEDYKDVCTTLTTLQKPSLTINGDTEVKLTYGQSWILKVKGAPNTPAKLSCFTPSGKETCNGLTLCTTDALGECSSEGSIPEGTELGLWKEYITLAGAQSNVIYFTVQKPTSGDAPQAPVNLQVDIVEFTNTKSVKLIWENGGGEVEKFYIYKNKDDGPFSWFSSTTEKVFKDEVGKDVKYGYYVTAVNNYGESGPSKTVYVHPSTQNYRNAKWTCYDGSGDSQGGSSSCKSSDTWKKIAEKFCDGKCNQDKSKCGVNSFGVSNECSDVQKCYDSDGGKKEFEKGTVTANGDSGTDYCSVSSTLIEHFCNDNKLDKVIFYCKNGCKDGACLTTNITTNQSKCFDSDGGKNYFVKGFAQGLAYSLNSNTYGFVTLYDTCVKSIGGDEYSESGPELIEQTCEGDKIIGQRFSCPNGCKDGACLKEPPAQLKAAIKKPFVWKVPFTLSAWAKSENSLINFVDWKLAEECEYATTPSGLSSADVSSYVTASINVVCYSVGPKTFYVTFKDENGNKAIDKINLFVDDSTTETGEIVISTVSDTTSTSLSSCKNRCGSYDAKAKCQCDAACINYADCCADKKQYCG